MEGYNKSIEDRLEAEFPHINGKLAVCRNVIHGDVQCIEL